MDRRSFFRSVTGTNETSQVSDVTLRANNGNRDRTKITSTLSPWTPDENHPWNTHSINHLYRRAGFGATLAEIAAAKGKSPSQVVDALLDNTLQSGGNMPAEPYKADTWLHVGPYLGGDYDKQLQQQSAYSYANLEIRRDWTVQMAKENTMLREKLSLFWMNHFVIESIKVYYPQMMYRYLDYMRKNAWGNFKQMVKDVTIQPGMLIYLDGVQSYRTLPNENYARELLELFAVGVADKDGNPNYTEPDIRDIAKALTGYRIQYDAAAPNVLPSYYEVTQHDATFKTIFGVKKPWGLASAGVADDVIDHIFESKKDAIAWYICSKLYQFFVYADISGSAERTIIDAMASTFKASNWELKPVLAELFKSEHFFDEANIGANIKSPYEYGVGLLRHFDIMPDRLQSGTLYYYTAAGGQILLDPPNVKGWRGYRAWISTTTLPYRNIAMAGQLMVSKSIPSYGSDGYGNAHTAITLPDATVTAWAKKFPSYATAYYAFFDELCDYLCAQPPSQKAKQYVLDKVALKDYEWLLIGDAEKTIVVRGLVAGIMLLADYQLS
jgi:uncharacterized protein (DUF1800 family)